MLTLQWLNSLHHNAGLTTFLIIFFEAQKFEILMKFDLLAVLLISHQSSHFLNHGHNESYIVWALILLYVAHQWFVFI